MPYEPLLMTLAVVIASLAAAAIATTMGSTRSVLRAAIAGAVAGALAVLGVKLGHKDAAAAAREKESAIAAVSRALEEGNLQGASDRWLWGPGNLLDQAEVHILAGRFEQAAAMLLRPDRREPPSARVVCLGDALLARAKDGAARAGALDRLRAAAAAGPDDARAFCGILLADLAPVAERGAILKPLPLTSGPLARAGLLLSLEAGTRPLVLPVDDRLPSVLPLLLRTPGRGDQSGLAVHLARFDNARHLGFDSHRRDVEDARAAVALSALGDHAAARDACARSRARVVFWKERKLGGCVMLQDYSPPLGAAESATICAAVELRAGNLHGARALMSDVPPQDPMRRLVELLDGAQTDLANTDPWYLAKIAERRKQAADGPLLAAELMRPGTRDDGEGLFLTAPLVSSGHEALRAWVRTGNVARDTAAPNPPPQSPFDSLVRLEERRSIAASLGDAALAADLEAKLARARAALLDRGTVLLRYLLQHTSRDEDR